MMRRIGSLLLPLVLAFAYAACSADAPGPAAPKPPGGGPSGTSPLRIQLFTSNPNPPAGSCTQIQAVVTLNGVSVPDGTGVSFSTDFGSFLQNSLPVISVTTQAGAALTALCSSASGLAVVRASAQVGSETGNASITIAFQPSGQFAPFFTFCNPSFGPATGGTTLTINGGRFLGSPSTTRVLFTAAGVTREGLVTMVSSTQVAVVTPAFLEVLSPSVPVEIRITFLTGTSSPLTLTIPNCFAFGTLPSTNPAVTAVLPSSGSNEGNTRVSIFGSGFRAPLQVFFGPVEAQVISITFNQLVVLTPPAFGAGAPNLNSTVAVRVHLVDTGVDSSPNGSFRFVTAIRLTSISNNQQRVDQSFTPATIFGQGFEAPVAVTLAGIPATVISVSATELLVLPGNPQLSGCTDLSGTVSVTNITTGDTATGLTFIYLVSQTRPVITGLSPNSGTAGTAVTIFGTNLGSVTNVLFGARPAIFTTSAGGISAVAPEGGVVVPPACPAGVPAGTLITTETVNVSVSNFRTGCVSSQAPPFRYVLPCVSTALADVAVVKTAPATVPTGTNITFSITVTNPGTLAASGVIMTDPLPAGLTFVSCMTTQGTCTFGGGIVTATIGTLAATSGSALVTIVANVPLPAMSVRVNTATVTTTSPEGNTSNNTSSATFTVTP